MIRPYKTLAILPIVSLVFFLFPIKNVLAESCNASVGLGLNPTTVTSVNDNITLSAILTITNPRACQSSFSSIGADFQFYWTSGHSTLITSGWSVLDLSNAPSPFVKTANVTTKLSDLGFTATQSAGITFYARVQGYGLKSGETTKADAIVFDPARYKFDETSSSINLGVNQEPVPVRKYSCVNKTCQSDPNGMYDGIESCLSVCEGGAFTPPPNSAGGGGNPGEFSIENPIGINTFEDLVNLIGVWIFNLSIPIVVIIIIYAGILMLTAGANPGQFKKGAEALKYAAIGLAIIFIGKGFVTLIQSILDLRNP